MADISVQIDKEVILALAPVDSTGASRDVQNVVYTLTSGTGVLTPDATGNGAVYVPAAGAPEVAVVSVSADADLTDAGVNTLSDSVTITSTALPIPQATSLGLTATEAPQA